MYDSGGGLLGLIQTVGGMLLWFLIGRRAWNRSLGAQVLRVFIGGSTAGIAIGLGLNRFLLPPPTPDSSLSEPEVVVLSMLGTVALAFVLLGFDRLASGSSSAPHSLPEPEMSQGVPLDDDGYDESEYDPGGPERN